MSTCFRLPRAGLGLLLAGVMILAVRPASGAPSLGGELDSTVRWVAGDTTDAPSVEPYTTDRSLAYHVLAAPAYVLHGVTRPIGWGVKYLEDEYPEFFEIPTPVRGVRPLLELGGPTGFLAGLALFDRRVFGGTHTARAEVLYGGPNTYRGAALYEVPAPFGPQTRLRLATTFFSDPRNEFYLGGNDSDRDADETFFFRRQLDGTVGVRASSPQDRLKGGIDVGYEHVTTRRGEGLQGDRLERAGPPGLGTVDLLTSRLLVGLDLTRGERRTYWGTEVLLQLDYTHDLAGDRFRYGRYVAELRQYLPVGIFPKSRRLALRARLEQVEPLFGGTAVPFYRRPELGGRRMLRGFRADRFQDSGSLLLTAEYRYPLWDNLDAAVFVDAGQVFPELGVVAAGRFHWSYGGGLHLLNRNGLAFRVEVAGSPEGMRTVLTVEPTFPRLVR